MSPDGTHAFQHTEKIVFILLLFSFFAENGGMKIGRQNYECIQNASGSMWLNRVYGFENIGTHTRSGGVKSWHWVCQSRTPRSKRADIKRLAKQNWGVFYGGGVGAARWCATSTYTQTHTQTDRVAFHTYTCHPSARWCGGVNDKMPACF